MIDRPVTTSEGKVGSRVAVRVRDVQKTFHRRRESVNVLRHINLEIEEGELLVLLGPSGCGKTTLLRCLVGLERPTEGVIELAGDTVVDTGRGVFTPPNKRNAGMVFQNYALWPHMKVADNVAYPLKARRRSDLLKSGRVGEVLETVQCAHLADRYPPELSGGQQQRISLARALASNPALLLLDEPLSNLDALLRVELRAQLRAIHRELGFTGVYVTHDQEEALALGSRVAVMDRGRIEQIGSPADVYRKPATEVIADFLGARNRFVESNDGHITTAADSRNPELDGRRPANTYSLRVRPSRLQLRARGDADSAQGVTWIPGGRVVEVLPGVDRREHVVAIDDEQYFVDLPVFGNRFAVGEDVEIGLPDRYTLRYDADGTLVD